MEIRRRLVHLVKVETACRRRSAQGRLVGCTSVVTTHAPSLPSSDLIPTRISFSSSSQRSFSSSSFQHAETRLDRTTVSIDVEYERTKTFDSSKRHASYSKIGRRQVRLVRPRLHPRQGSRKVRRTHLRRTRKRFRRSSVLAASPFPFSRGLSLGFSHRLDPEARQGSRTARLRPKRANLVFETVHVQNEEPLHEPQSGQQSRPARRCRLG